MTKSTFITKVANLQSSNYDYARKEGFKECKDAVLELATELDEQGMTPETYRIFREQVEESNALYEELFKLQKELANKSRTILQLKSDAYESEDELMQAKRDLKALEQASISKTFLLEIIKTVVTEKATFEEAILILKNRFNIDILTEGKIIE